MVTYWPNGSPWPSPAASESEDDFGENVQEYFGHDPGIWPSEIEGPDGETFPGVDGILPAEYEEPDGTLYRGGGPGMRERGYYGESDDSSSDEGEFDPDWFREPGDERHWH